MVQGISDIPVVGEKKTHVNVNEKFLKAQVSKYIELARDIMLTDKTIGMVYHNRSEIVINLAKLIQKQNLFIDHE